MSWLGSPGQIEEAAQLRLLRLREQGHVQRALPAPQDRAKSDHQKLVADADLGVEPKRADSFGNEAYSTKIMEFISVGVPVVVSATRVHRHYFDESVVRFFESGNDTELAQAMYEALTNSQLRASLVRNAHGYVARHHWGRHKSEYLRLVDSLIARQSDSKQRQRPV